MGYLIGITDHHALVHAVEGQFRLLGRPEESAVDAELVAVDALAEDDIVAVAALHQLAVDQQVAILFLNAPLQLGVVVLGLAPILLRLGELELLLAIEAVDLATLVVGNRLAVGGKDETHRLALGVEVAVHQLVPLQKSLLRKSGACNKQHRHSHKYFFHINNYSSCGT